MEDRAEAPETNITCFLRPDCWPELGCVLAQLGRPTLPFVSAFREADGPRLDIFKQLSRIQIGHAALVLWTVVLGLVAD